MVRLQPLERLQDEEAYTVFRINGPLEVEAGSAFAAGDWHQIIDEKLKKLDELYQLLKHDQTKRWMMLLEATIVLLFVVDPILRMRAT